ncbi:unnamed protein product [Prunus armeniaca]|nr:hypothetical protein GBA52_024612 [Prunus armeniaca]
MDGGTVIGGSGGMWSLLWQGEGSEAVRLCNCSNSCVVWLLLCCNCRTVRQSSDDCWMRLGSKRWLQGAGSYREFLEHAALAATGGYCKVLADAVSSSCSEVSTMKP